MQRSTINYQLIQHNGNTISRYSSDPVFSNTDFRYCPLSGNECTNYLRLSRSRSDRYTILPEELKLYPLLTIVGYNWPDMLQAHSGNTDIERIYGYMDIRV